ncbi:MAG: thioredoxin family protein [Alphaproteobacteria bacterium]
MSASDIATLFGVDAQQYLTEAENPLLVEVGAAWCAPCRMLRPILAKLAAEFRDHMTVVEIDADRSRELVREWDVEGLPTLLLLRQGRLSDRMTGLPRYADLRTRVCALLDGLATDHGSNGESAFAAAVARAEAAREAPTSPSDDPAQVELSRALTAYNEVTDGLRAQLNGNAISKQEFDRRQAAERDRLLGPVQPALDAALAAGRAAEATFIAAVEGATGEFLSAQRDLPSSAPERQARFCAPGDPYCSLD